MSPHRTQLRNRVANDAFWLHEVRELFNLYADPRETRNLIQSDTGMLEKLEAELEHYESTDTLPALDLRDEDRERLRALGYIQ